jgi:hypothetical protein
LGEGGKSRQEQRSYGSNNTAHATKSPASSWR